MKAIIEANQQEREKGRKKNNLNSSPILPKKSQKIRLTSFNVLFQNFPRKSTSSPKLSKEFP